MLYGQLLRIMESIQLPILAPESLSTMAVGFSIAEMITQLKFLHLSKPLHPLLGKSEGSAFFQSVRIQMLCREKSPRLWIRFLFPHNKLPQTQLGLKHHPFIISQFCRSEAQRLEELCFGSHKAEIMVLAALGFLEQALGEHVSWLVQVVGRIRFYVVAGLRSRLSCWLFGRGHSQLLEGNWLPFSPSASSSLTPAGQISLL